jgi:hypothetical protein
MYIFFSGFTAMFKALDKVNYSTLNLNKSKENVKEALRGVLDTSLCDKVCDLRWVGDFGFLHQ